MTQRAADKTHDAPSGALCIDAVRCPEGVRVSFFARHDMDLIPWGYAVNAVDFTEVDQVAADLKFLLGRANLFGEMGPAATDEIARLALLLFDLLIPPALKPILRAGEGALTLRLDETLQHLPWEVMHTGEHYLARQYAMSRTLVLPGIVTPPPQRSLGETTQVLIIADPRDDLPASAREGLALRDAFLTRFDVELGFKTAPVSRAYVRENLREYDVLHFAGHAEWDERGGGWLLDDGRFGPDDVRKLAGGRPLPALVFANACSSGASGRADLDHMAQALLTAGVSNVIGTVWDIPDTIGAHFAQLCYDYLLAGWPVGEALRRSRVEMAHRHGDGTVLWGSYVLYGSPDTVYFKELSAPAPTLNIPDEIASTTLPQSPIAPHATLRSAHAHPSALHEQLLRLRRSLVLTAQLCAILLSVGLIHMLWPTDWSLPNPAPSPTTQPIAGALTAEPDALPSITALDLDVQASGRVLDAHGHVRTVQLHAGDVLWAGDQLRLHITTSDAVFTYVLHIQSHGQTRLLYPLDRDETHTHTQLTLPSTDTWYRLDDNAGDEFFLVASTYRAPSTDELHTLMRELETMIQGHTHAAGVQQVPRYQIKRHLEGRGFQVDGFNIETR